MGSKLNILLLCDFSCKAATIVDHIHGIKDFSKHNIYLVANLGELPKKFKFNYFDVIIIHYSIIASAPNYLGPKTFQKIKAFKGLKCIFIQDEYRFINRTIKALNDLEINILFSVVPEDSIDKVYPPHLLPYIVKQTVLTGYVPEPLTKLKVPNYADRKIDVGYRARDLPFWLGDLGQEKKIIAEKFLQDAKKYNLNCNFSCREEDRLFFDAWINFITSCKAMLGVESGASVCDFEGNIQNAVDNHVKNYPNASYQEVKQQYFADIDGKIEIRAISPRVFEMAALRTLMIMYEGYYSGILQPWRHYVPLKKDHSNMEEVIAFINDEKKAQEIIDNAYQEVALNKQNCFRYMVDVMDQLIDKHVDHNHVSNIKEEKINSHLQKVMKYSILRKLNSHIKLLPSRLYKIIFRPKYAFLRFKQIVNSSKTRTS